MSITTEPTAAEWFEERAAQTPMPGARKMFKIAAAALREKAERENPKPLTIEELKQMMGEPVYLEDLVHKACPEEPDLWGGWIVFSKHNQNGFTPRGGGFFTAGGYGKTWLAYRYKPKEE